MLQHFAAGKQSSLFQGNFSIYVSLCNKISPRDCREGIAYCFKANHLSKTSLFLNFMETSLLHGSVLLVHDVWRVQLPPDFCKHLCLFSRASTNQSFALISLCVLFSVRIYSSSLLDVPVDFFKGRKMTAFSQMLCVPFQLQLGNNTASEPGLQGMQIPCTKTVLPSQTNQSRLCLAAES